MVYEPGSGVPMDASSVLPRYKVLDKMLKVYLVHTLRSAQGWTQKWVNSLAKNPASQ